MAAALGAERRGGGVGVAAGGTYDIGGQGDAAATAEVGGRLAGTPALGAKTDRGIPGAGLRGATTATAGTAAEGV